jgi:hypothetical protein
MRLWLATVFATALLPAVPLAKTFDDGAMCDSPPCSRHELQRYQKVVIRRALRANALASEASSRGEKVEAARLRKVYLRNRERRDAIQKAMETASD